MHLQADPTKLELLHRSFKVKKEDFKEEQRESILEKVHRDDPSSLLVVVPRQTPFKPKCFCTAELLISCWLNKG